MAAASSASASCSSLAASRQLVIMAASASQKCAQMWPLARSAAWPQRRRLGGIARSLALKASRLILAYRVGVSAGAGASWLIGIGSGARQHRISASALIAAAALGWPYRRRSARRKWRVIVAYHLSAAASWRLSSAALAAARRGGGIARGGIALCSLALQRTRISSWRPHPRGVAQSILIIILITYKWRKSAQLALGGVASSRLARSASRRSWRRSSLIMALGIV